MGSDNNNSDDGLNDYDRDKLQKQSLVLSTLTTVFKSYNSTNNPSPHTDIQTIANALQSNKYKLGIENLSGGYTNYTYKVFLTPIATNEEDIHIGDDVIDTALFVKLCFPRAFWNPDPDYVYDVQRIVNEHDMMEKFAQLVPGCVATPYLLLDIDDMKLLVTQWSSAADEQMSNQFIDGVADKRIATKLANAIATLHCKCDIEQTFNTEARDCMIDMFPSMEEELVKMANNTNDGPDSNRATQLAKEMGADICSMIFDNITKSYREENIPCHTDLHTFNILVEKKPRIDLFSEKDDIFGENGNVVICDWEMAMVGPLGLDMGRLYSIPVACILAHAISGNHEILDGMIEWLDLYWQEYSSTMMQLGGKDDKFLCNSYRNALAWLGWKLFAMSIFEWFIPFLPIESEDVGTLRESLGVVGISLLRLGFGGYEKDLTLDELHSWLNTTIMDEVSAIKSARHDRPSLRRKSSVLRETNRRVSDAFVGVSRESLKMMIADMTEAGLNY